MARVTLYLPDELREEWLASSPTINLSQILRLGLIAKLRAAHQPGQGEQSGATDRISA